MAPPLSPDLLKILADPETHEPVSLATDAQLEALRERVDAGRARTKSGEAPPKDFEAALLAQGGRVAYLVHEGVPNFIVDDRIELDEPL